MTLTTESAARKDRTTGKTATLEHRHFAFIAAALAGMPEAVNLDRAAWESVCRYFAKECAGTNPRFDRKRFMAACGVAE